MEKRHFQEIPNRPAPMNQITPEDCALTEDEDCLDIDTAPSTVEEVQASKVNLKTSKASRVDCIETYMLEVDPKLAAGYLWTLFEHKREKVKTSDG